MDTLGHFAVFVEVDKDARFRGKVVVDEVLERGVDLLPRRWGLVEVDFFVARRRSEEATEAVDGECGSLLFSRFQPALLGEDEVVVLVVRERHIQIVGKPVLLDAREEGHEAARRLTGSRGSCSVRHSVGFQELDHGIDSIDVVVRRLERQPVPKSIRKSENQKMKSNVKKIKKKLNLSRQE